MSLQRQDVCLQNKFSYLVPFSVYFFLYSISVFRAHCGWTCGNKKDVC